ncbi:MAG: hypothetical protein PHD04_02880 [Candidatus Pacebacteria bacterium]|nr:hypothetical protein [Candidatus Paceibacterota bacterium]
MIPVKFVFDNVVDACHAENNTALKARIWRTINIQYAEICRNVSWYNLRTSVEVNFASVSPTGAGMWLPSNIFGIDAVREHDEEYEFIERDSSAMEEDEYGYRFTRVRGSDTALIDAEDLVVNKGGSSFASTAVDAYVAAGGTVSGQYMRIGSQMGYYKIGSNTSPYSITPTYQGESQSGTNCPFMVRPPETQKMHIYDASEEELEDRTVVVYYWKCPDPLYRDQDMIVLPSSSLLELLTLRKLPEAKTLRPVSQNELDGAWASTIKLNPAFKRLPNPRDKHNNIFAFNEGMHSTRGE